MGQLSSLLVLLCSAWMLIGCGAQPTTGIQPPTGQQTELEKIQGTWRLDLGKRGYVLKEISSGREVVSHYDRKGRLTAQHSAAIDVIRVSPESAPAVRVFSFKELQVTSGSQPAWPHDQTKGHYIYTCDGNRFVEYQWSVGELHVNAKPRVVVWRREVTSAQPVYSPTTTQPDIYRF